ncbi:hypothetical protein DSM112329_02367 [Paraconexibacter sp. AEG42_29]|uniref:PKD domain-containing protein n=1 Tax=Paraconexibacter sp. AEG42_29 TaxID=2997339 RepID=A0AAU7AV40_9ACTN
MLRGGTLISAAAAVLAAAAVPAAAQAADTYTVDKAAAEGCSAAKVCKTIAAAVAAVADGDAITVPEGSYDEPAIALTKKNVKITGVAGKTTVNVAAPATAGDPAFKIIEGTQLDGLTIAPGMNSGPAVLVTGVGTTFRNGAIVRLSPSSSDAPAYKVDPLVGSGVSTLSRITILNGPAGSTGQTQPAIAGNGTSSLAVNDAVVISGVGNGPALGITGSDTTGATPAPNTVLRSSLIASNPAADALSFTSAAGSTTKKALEVDTTILLGGGNASGVKVASLTSGTPTDSAGDLTATFKHVTISGAGKPFFVDAGAAALGTAVGNIAVTFERSIVQGKAPGTVKAFTPLLGLLGAASTADVTIKNSDTDTGAFTQAGGGKGKITKTDSDGNTAPSGLFADPAKLNYNLRIDAPVIDKGGAFVQGESTTDVAGVDRRTITTDLGAYEFVNHAPVAGATTNTVKPKQNEVVTFDASKSFDFDPGDRIVSYKWFFGDTQVAETTTPTTTHAYSVLGIFNPTVTAVDTKGLESPAGKIATLVVGDGAAPVVGVSKPSRGGSYAITVKSRVGGKIKNVFDKDLLKKVIFAGKATDASGIKFVQISIQRLAIGSATVPASPKTCVFLGTNKTTFQTASCKKPIFFTVANKDGVFSYHLKSTVRPKAGKYQLAVLAVDGADVLSNAFTVPFTLK